MGIALAFLVALLDSGKNMSVKMGVAKFSGLITAWAWQLTGLFVMVPAIIIVGIPEIEPVFWLYLVAKTLLYVGALILYANSLKETDASLALPMLALTPLITTGTSFLLSGEFPSTVGLIGILVIVTGLYLLKSESGRGVLEPFKAVFRDKGMLYMLTVAVIYGLTTSIDKEAVLNSSPIFYSALTTVTSILVLTPLVYIRQKDEIKKVISWGGVKTLFPAGILDGLLVITQMTAVTMTLASYVISIKRTSIIISAVLAHLIFGEELKRRIVPIFVMFMGLIFVIFS